MKKLLFIALIVGIGGCKYLRKDDERKPIARVNDAYLYVDEIGGLTTGLTPEDSVTLVRNFIYNWGKEQLLIERAEYNLRTEQKDFEELVKQYRNDLIKFAYLEKYVNENLDTTISENEIKSYYTDHSEDFELKENILKADYFIIPSNAPDIKKARDWWREDSEKSQAKFLEYTSVFARTKVVGDTNWVRYEDFTRMVPLQIYNQQEFLSRNRRIVLEDTAATYFVNITSTKIKDDVSPLPYVKSTIKSIILNKRKLELIARMEEKLVDDAYDKKNFEIY